MNTNTLSIPVRDNISLRFIQPNEAEALYALVDKNRAYLRKWLNWVDEQTGPEVSRENILKRIEEARAGKALDLGVSMDGKLIGSMGFNGIRASKRRAEIGYWLSKEYEGQGIMTDCVRALVDMGFRELKLHRIEIHCSTNNAKSAAIPEKLGFKLDGILRDDTFLYDHFESSNVYSMIENEWKHPKR